MKILVPILENLNYGVEVIDKNSFVQVKRHFSFKNDILLQEEKKKEESKDIV